VATTYVYVSIVSTGTYEEVSDTYVNLLTCLTYILHKSLFLFLLYVDTHPCYAEETRGEVSSIEVCKTCSAGVVADGEESALEDLSTFFAAAAKRRGAAAQFVGGGFMVRIIYY